MKARRGNAAIEFALVLPITLVLVFGLMDWGWYLMHRMSLSRAAQQGARLAAGVTDANNPEGVAEAEIRRWLGVTGMEESDFTVTVTRVDMDSGPVLRLELSSDYQPLIPLVPVPRVLSEVATVGWYGDMLEEE